VKLRISLIACNFVASALSFANPPDAPHSNILLILVDDLAWSDLGCYGHPWHQTPHLNRLAQQGMRFTDAYAPAPNGPASRASILTGTTPPSHESEVASTAQVKHRPEAWSRCNRRPFEPFDYSGNSR